MWKQVGTGGENYWACWEIEKDTDDGTMLDSFGDSLMEKLEVVIKREISERVLHANCCCVSQ